MARKIGQPRKPFVCNAFKTCECGCGQLIPEKDSQYRKLRFKRGHQHKTEVRIIYCKCGCGQELEESSRRQYKKGKDYRRREYIAGHQNKKPRDYGDTISCACGCGEMITEYRYRTGRGGRKIRYKVKYQVGHGVRGERNHFWKGGVTEKNENERVKFKYKQWRRAVLRRDDYTCQRCKVRNEKGLGKTVVLHVDHIKTFADYPELRYVLDNGRTLCMACHYFVTYGRELPKGKIWALRPGKVLDKVLSNI